MVNEEKDGGCRPFFVFLHSEKTYEQWHLLTQWYPMD